MRGWSWLLGTLLLVPAPLAAAASGDDEAGGVETPAEALKKAAPTATEAPRPAGFGGGLFRVTEPVDDLTEPVPLGTRDEFERTGYELEVEGRIQVFVDKAGQIYVDRPYQGVIPDIRNSLEPERFKRLRGRDMICWVGFQPMAASSRIFWLLTDPAPRFEVTRLSGTRIEVFFPGAKVATYQELRPLITDKFTSPVALIDGRRVRGGVKYLIELKRPANFLHRFEDPFLYLEVESDLQ